MKKELILMCSFLPAMALACFSCSYHDELCESPPQQESPVIKPNNNGFRTNERPWYDGSVSLHGDYEDYNIEFKYYAVTNY